MGRNPRRQIIAASYNSDLANDFGRNVRNIVAEPEFGQVFPGVGLSSDSAAANRMNTNKGGAYVAAGVGTAVTGRGADIALIDDPFKDREEADSERRREVLIQEQTRRPARRSLGGHAAVSPRRRRSRSAANASAARMSSRSRSGKSARISSSVIPPAR